MSTVEKSLDEGSYVIYGPSSPDEPVAIFERRERFSTLMWSSQLGVSESLNAFRPIISSGDIEASKEITFVACNGYSRRATGNDVDTWINDLENSPETVSTVRLECVIEGLGAVALAFNRSVPGMNLAEGAVSVTAERLDSGCIQSLFEQSAVPEVASEFVKLTESLSPDETAL